MWENYKIYNLKKYSHALLNLNLSLIYIIPEEETENVLLRMITGRFASFHFYFVDSSVCYFRNMDTISYRNIITVVC